MTLEIDEQGELQEARAMAIEYWRQYFKDNFNHSENAQELEELVTQSAEFSECFALYLIGERKQFDSLIERERSKIIERIALDKVNGVSK